MKTGKTLLQANDMIKRYQDVLALDHVTMQIEEGDIVGLLGPNGAGKSTWINCVTSIIPYDSGTVEIFGKSCKKHMMSIKRDIGLVPQDISYYNDITAYENVSFFASLYGFKGEQRNKQVKEALEFVGLWGRHKDKPKKFSGGMKRRLNIACAIAHNPKLIIMDEPTVGIDPQSRNHILDSVKQLNERGATIIYTSHYMEEVEAICNTIKILDHGRVIAEGSKQQLRDMVSKELNIEFELSGVNPTMLEAVRHMEEVVDVHLNHQLLSVVSLSNDLEMLIKTIKTNGASIEAMQMKQCSLEDVFLTLTGRSLRD